MVKVHFICALNFQRLNTKCCIKNSPTLQVIDYPLHATRKRLVEISACKYTMAMLQKEAQFTEIATQGPSPSKKQKLCPRKVSWTFYSTASLWCQLLWMHTLGQLSQKWLAWLTKNKEVFLDSGSWRSCFCSSCSATHSLHWVLVAFLQLPLVSVSTTLIFDQL